MAAETSKITKLAYEQLHRIQEYHSFATQAGLRVLVSVRNLVDRSRIWSLCTTSDSAEDVCGSLLPFQGLSDTMVQKHRDELEKQRKNLAVVQDVLVSHQRSAFDTLSAAEDLLSQSKRAGTHTLYTPLQPLPMVDLHLLVEGAARLIAQDVLARLCVIDTVKEAACIQWEDPPTASSAGFVKSLTTLDSALETWQSCDWLGRAGGTRHESSGHQEHSLHQQGSRDSVEPLCQAVSELAWRLSARSLQAWLQSTEETSSPED